MENNKDMNATMEENKKIGDYKRKSMENKVGNQNIIVDCVHMNVDEDLDEEGSEGSEVKDGCTACVQVPNEGSLSINLLWPDDVKLYQPLEREQLLFSEMANCLYVQACLRMYNLRYTVVEMKNAECIGPSGEVPVLRCGKFIVSGAEKIVKFIEEKGICLTGSLTESKKSEMSCYISLVQMTLANAEDFITWLDPETYNKVTWNKYCSVYPWPLSSYLIRQKRQKIKNKLAAMGWARKSFEDVCEEINICFQALSDKMEGPFFFGNQVTCIDTLVFAHAYAIMKTPLPKPQLAGIICGYPKIVKHCYRVIDSYFHELNTSNQFAELVNNLSY